MQKNTFIVIYPYKFSLFIWDLLELNDISNHAEVQVWDISKIINKNFSENFSNKSLIRKEIKNFESIYSFVIYLNDFFKINKINNICVLNEVSKSTPKSLIVNLILNYYLKPDNIKIVDLYNGGIPISYPNQKTPEKKINIGIEFLYKLNKLYKNTTNFKEIIYILVMYFSSNFGKIFSFKLTHRIVAGRGWALAALKDLKSNTEIIPGHSHDYSSYLSSNKLSLIENYKEQEIAVLLDSAGPLFPSDYSLTKRKDPTTVEKWYPVATNFFDYLEDKTRVRIEIAGHYKSSHVSPAPCFGYREVKYGLTREMVKRAKYVITRYSTAISYAVIYRKPILFIYSDELKLDKQAMVHITGMAEMLGTTAINIDHFNGDIENYLKVDEERYIIYEREALTSKPLSKPNFQIILEDIMRI